MESGDDVILKNLCKGITTEDIEMVIKLTTEVGITSKLFVMYNLPGENERSLDNTLNFLRSIFSKYDVDLIRVSEYVDIPGSIGRKSQLRKSNIPDVHLEKFKDTLAEICSEHNIIMNDFKYA